MRPISFSQILALESFLGAVAVAAAAIFFPWTFWAELFPACFAEAAVAGDFVLAWQPGRLLLHIGLGLLATLPLVLAAWFGLRSATQLGSRMQETVDQLLYPLLRDLQLWQVLGVAAAAGIGEELFFRGLIQFGISVALGGDFSALLMGLVVGSLVFGLCHWVHVEYGLLATAVGVYLGLLAWLSGSLLVPIVVHAVYDAWALLIILRRRPPVDEAAGDT